MPQLNRPWLVAVWPGMGHVAINAGVYLLSHLRMAAVAELEAPELFDIDHVEVKNGIVQPVRRARNRFFAWADPNKVRDLVVFVGEDQPPVGRFRFCQHLVSYARELGVERVITFAAMATAMHPTDVSRVFGAATDQEKLDAVSRPGVTILEDGNIGGLNGVLLGAAASAGVPGACLLGEIPHMLARLPFPKASLAVLEVFRNVAGIEVDLTELAEQADVVDSQIGDLLERMQEAAEEGGSADEEESQEFPEPEEDEELPAADRHRIEELFRQAENDRGKAFELKRELDRLGRFPEYENRFLDLFRSK